MNIVCTFTFMHSYIHTCTLLLEITFKEMNLEKMRGEKKNKKNKKRGRGKKDGKESGL